MSPLAPKPRDDMEHHASHASLAEDKDSSPASSTTFAELPTELRLRIWREALPAPRVIFVAEYCNDDLDEFTPCDDDDDGDYTPIAAMLVPSCLHSAEDFAIERSCAEARDLVASMYKPIVCPPPGDPWRRIWNGFSSLEFPPDMESAIAWPEDIRVDLSRDILYVEAQNVTEFRLFFKIPHLDLPRVLKETRRLAITVDAFIEYQSMERAESRLGNSMVHPNEREYKVFGDMEANIPQSIELLRKFENVQDVILLLCGCCRFYGYLSDQISANHKKEWQDWGLVPCSLSSLPVSAPDLAKRPYPYWFTQNPSLNDMWIDQAILLRGFRTRSVVQALEEEKENGRLGRVKKIRLAEVVRNITDDPKYFTPGWYHCCRATGEHFNVHSRVKDQDIRFI